MLLIFMKHRKVSFYLRHWHLLNLVHHVRSLFTPVAFYYVALY